jgi:hypothetical protein
MTKTLQEALAAYLEARQALHEAVQTVAAVATCARREEGPRKDAWLTANRIYDEACAAYVEAANAWKVARDALKGPR